mmetsp:Transcript_36755/g.43914  ORF Transcript_36755/g.43914 Transcript_36755/m.43914 type:complete len:410 (+) Transcript_36755:87-1316(+)
MCEATAPTIVPLFRNNRSRFKPLFDIINKFIEFYLTSVIKRALILHEFFYNWLNVAIRTSLDGCSECIPKWFTANFITYARTVLVIPCITLLALGYQVLPSTIVILVDFGDFLDGVVARFWVDIEKEKDALDGNRKRCISREADFDSSKSPQCFTSWVSNYHDQKYGGFIDAICDKAFIVPCWIFLLSTVKSSGFMTTAEYVTLWCLICIETASACIRFRAFYLGSGVAPPTLKGLNFSSSAVKADHIGKVKQTFEMVGTSLLILPRFRIIGLAFLSSSVPLAYESVRRKITNRVMYVEAKFEVVDYRTQKFWKQVKGLGSKLIVGIPSDKHTASMILNVSASDSVDYVMTMAPEKVSLEFLDEIGAHYIVCSAAQSSVTKEVAMAKRCLVIGDNDVAWPMELKEQKDD